MYHHNMQNNTTDCGIAVLRTILQQYKRNLIQSDFSLIDIGDEQGLSLNDLSNILKHHGIVTGAYEVTDFDELKKIKFPAVAIIDNNGLSHYVVIHGYSDKNGFVISNPALTDLTEIGFIEFQKIFSGYILLIEEILAEHEDKKSCYNLYREVVGTISILSKIKYTFLSILKWGSPVLLLYTMQYLVMYQIEKISIQNTIATVMLFVVIAVQYYYVSLVFHAERSDLSRKISTKMAIDYLMNEVELHDDKRFSNDTEGIFWNIVISVTGIIQKFFLKVDAIIIMVSILTLAAIDWRYALLVISFMAIVCGYCFYARTAIKNEQISLISSSSEVSGCVQEMTQSGTDLKVYTKSNIVEDYCRSVYDRYATVQNKLGRSEIKIMATYDMYSYIFMALGMALLFFSYIGVATVSSSGALISFLMSVFMIMLFKPSMQKWIDYQKSTSAIEYIEFVKKPQHIRKEVAKIEVDAIKHIQLKDISFAFNNKSVLDQINVTFQTGKIVGICGENGAGKTTLAKILLGLISPSSGTFIINSNVSLDTLYNTNVTEFVGLFASNMYIYSSSVANNITFSIFKDNTSMKGVSCMNNLPEDYLLFYNGINISQGERQKILLDRCVTKNKDIYVFDEPGINLDLASQKEMIKLFEELKNKNKAVIIISHDSFVLDHCDECYVLENKKLVRKG